MTVTVTVYVPVVQEFDFPGEGVGWVHPQADVGVHLRVAPLHIQRPREQEGHDRLQDLHPTPQRAPQLLAPESDGGVRG